MDKELVIEQYLVVQDSKTGEIYPGLPSPRLIDVTGRQGSQDAYYHIEDGWKKGIWYLRDVGYESEDGNYVKVRVIRNPDYREYV